MQCEVIFSHSVKLIGKLIQLKKGIARLGANLSNVQLQLSKTISEVLESKEDVEVILLLPYTYIKRGGEEAWERRVTLSV